MSVLRICLITPCCTIRLPYIASFRPVLAKPFFSAEDFMAPRTPRESPPVVGERCAQSSNERPPILQHAASGQYGSHWTRTVRYRETASALESAQFVRLGCGVMYRNPPIPELSLLGSIGCFRLLKTARLDGPGPGFSHQPGT